MPLQASPCRARMDGHEPRAVHYVLTTVDAPPITPDDLQVLRSSPSVQLAEAEGDNFGGHFGVKVVVSERRLLGEVHEFVVDVLSRRSRRFESVIH